MVANRYVQACRRACAGLRTSAAIVTMVSVLALPGCAALEPWLRDGTGTAPEEMEAPEETEAPEASGAAETGAPELAEHEHAASEPPALEVAVLDPADYRRGIDRRKRALADSAAAEAASGTDTGYYLDVQEAQLRQALNGTGIGLFREHLAIRLRIPGTEAFATGSAQLNPAVEESLATVAEVLEDYHLTLVVVHGHTDPAGDAASNQRLSEQRALAVARRLVESGLAAERIVTVGHGESRPLAHDITSPESRWPDRRIDIELELIDR